MSKPKHIYIISAARKVWYWSEERKKAIQEASKGNKVQCAECKEWLSKTAKKGHRKLYSVDHVIPIVPFEKTVPSLPRGLKSMSWDEYLNNMMFGKLQVLCNECHKKKTRKENEARKKHKSK